MKSVSSYTPTSWRAPVGLVVAGLLGLGAASVSACRLPNLDHCLHKAVDANAWCADQDADKPFCSPCAHEPGCVATEPTEDACPAYSAPPVGTTGDTDSDTGDTDSGTGDTDSGTGDTDSGTGDTDSGTGDTDSGTGDTDSSTGTG